MKSCDGDVTCVNGCCRNNPCQNGGTCTDSCQAYKAGEEIKTGLYTVIDDSNQSFQMFCDFDSEPGFAWNLIQSFRR